MGVPYKLFYRLGFHPWEDLAEHPPFAEKLSELFAREESGREPPYGPALDLGGGSAVWAVQLAKRGWQVTSIDIVDKALERARERVREASRSAVEAAFPDWEITDIEVADTEPDAIARLLKFDEHFYRLHRTVTLGGEAAGVRD